MEKNNYKDLRILLLSDNFCHLEKLIQEFYQENKDEISSICKFEIIFKDGTRIIGKTTDNNLRGYCFDQWIKEKSLTMFHGQFYEDLSRALIHSRIPQEFRLIEIDEVRN